MLGGSQGTRLKIPIDGSNFDNDSKSGMVDVMQFARTQSASFCHVEPMARRCRAPALRGCHEHGVLAMIEAILRRFRSSQCGFKDRQVKVSSQV